MKTFWNLSTAKPTGHSIPAEPALILYPPAALNEPMNVLVILPSAAILRIPPSSATYKFPCASEVMPDAPGTGESTVVINPWGVIMRTRLLPTSVM